MQIVAKRAENIRSKLKRLVTYGILVETVPGLFAPAALVAGPQALRARTGYLPQNPGDELDINPRNVL